jgi:hypothetical protein
MILGYTLAQARKAVISAIVLVAAAVGLFVAVDPNFTQAVIALAGAGFGVAGVFAAKNHTVDDLSKAVAQLQASALSAVGFYVTVPMSTVGKISTLVAALLSAYAVYRVPNGTSLRSRTRT